MPDPIDRMIEILDGFEVPYDDLGVGLHHTVCRTNVGSTFWLHNYAGNAETQLDDASLGGLVKAAIMHAGACPGAPAAVEEPERRAYASDADDTNARRSDPAGPSARGSLLRCLSWWCR